jgi:hypothetical protein
MPTDCHLCFPLNSGINDLVILACISFAIYNSVPLVFLMAYITKFIHYTIAKSAVMPVPGRIPWAPYPL